MAGQRTVRFTARGAVAVVDAALAAGKIHPRSRDGWIVRVARGGQAGAKAITDLLSLVPADPATRARWAREQPRAAADPTHIGGDDEDALYATLYPSDEQAAAWAERRHGGTEPDRLAQAAERQAYLMSQAAAPPAEPADLTHGPAATVHDHEHADYAGGIHSHPHAHAGDAAHAPDPGTHPHEDPPPDAAAARGITARRMARIRVNPGDPAAGADLEQVFTRLFGKPG